MKLKLNILPRAERDAQHIFQWIEERSPEGARRWWFAFENAVQKLTSNLQAYALAPEDAVTDYELRQFLFKTRRGRTYRGVFTIIGNELRVLRLRGPGQASLESDELE